jgi:hypothetical protein
MTSIPALVETAAKGAHDLRELDGKQIHEASQLAGADARRAAASLAE